MAGNGENLLPMGRDEQKEEREVLDSIFPDEITGMSLKVYSNT